MIGLFRPVTKRLGADAKVMVQRAHCTGCVSLRTHGSWTATLGYPYEADVLQWLIMAFSSNRALSKKSPCTAMPVIPRTLSSLSSDTEEILSAFSIVVGWATASDHERDSDSHLAGFLRRRFDPLLEAALDRLQVPIGAAPDPRLLADLDESQASSIDGLLSLYDPFVAGLWRHGFRASEVPALLGNRGEQLARALSDAMLLADAWSDRHDDARHGRPNPAIAKPSAVKKVLEERLQELCFLSVSAREPYRELLSNTFGYGVQNRMTRKAKTDDKK